MITSASRPKKILIHAINFSPEIIGCGKFTTELAQYLASSGNTVEVITAPPHYPGWFVRDPYRGFAYFCDMLGSIKVTRCPILLKANAGGIWRLLAPLSFAVAAAPVVAWRICRSRPDVVLCVEPTLFSAPVAMITAKLTGVVCILHVQDLEVDAAFEVGYIKGAFIRKAATAIESAFLKKFDKIVTISNKMRERLIAKIFDESRVVVVRNWVDVTAITPTSRGKPNSFRRDLGISESHFVVLYAGHIGAKQALDIIIDAARRIKDRNDIHFVIAGDGPLKRRLIDESSELPNVSHLGLQPTDRLNELLGMADLHVLPQHQGAADLVLPSKLGGMLASGRPIVATADPGTELFEILSGIALLTPAGDSRALSETICQAKNKDLWGSVEKGLILAESLAASRLLPKFERVLFDMPETD